MSAFRIKFIGRRYVCENKFTIFTMKLSLKLEKILPLLSDSLVAFESLFLFNDNHNGDVIKSLMSSWFIFDCNMFFAKLCY